MARYIMLALNGPAGSEADEATYGQWYQDVHIPEMLAVPGVTSARRYQTLHSSTDWRYVSVFEIETDDLATTTAALRTSVQPSDPALDKGETGQLLAIALGN